MKAKQNKPNNLWKKLLALPVICCMLTACCAIPVLAYDGAGSDTTATESSDATIIRDTDNTEEDSHAFSVEGNGTLTDEADSSQNKLFYIVTTENGNHFYLIIDKDSTTNNVYMLSAIDERDLSDFIEEDSATDSPIDSEDPGIGSNPSILDEPQTDAQSETEPETESSDTKQEASGQKKSAGKYAGFLLIALIGGGILIGYYFLKIRNRDDQDDIDETAYGNEEIEEDDSDATEAEEIEEDDDSHPNEEDSDRKEESNEGDVPFVDYPDLVEDTDEE